MALKAVCVMKGDGETQGVINLCQEVKYVKWLKLEIRCDYHIDIGPHGQCLICSRLA